VVTGVRGPGNRNWPDRRQGIAYLPSTDDRAGPIQSGRHQMSTFVLEVLASRRDELSRLVRSVYGYSRLPERLRDWELLPDALEAYERALAPVRQQLIYHGMVNCLGRSAETAHELLVISARAALFSLQLALESAPHEPDRSRERERFADKMGSRGTHRDFGYLQKTLTEEARDLEAANSATHTADAEEEPEWYSTNEDERPPEFRKDWMLAGTRKDLSRWLGGRSGRSDRLPQAARNGVVWVCRIHRTLFHAYLRSESQYEEANQRRLEDESNPANK